MIRRLRQLLIAVMFGVLGAAAGRVASDMRNQQAAGEEPSQINLDSIDLHPRDIAPGIFAAMRVTSAPWSWLHVPPWLAAFAVNFVFVGFAKELKSLKDMSGLPTMGEPVWQDDPEAVDIEGSAIDGQTVDGAASDAVEDSRTDAAPETALDANESASI